jgi:hypothetical protein
MTDKIWAEISKTKSSIFPPFCYYSHDIKDQIDAIKEFQMIVGGDFVQYN